MSGSKRGSTHAGQPVALPGGHYEPPSPVEESTLGLVVRFQGEDDRARQFRVDRLPLPGWHPALAGALAAAVGPGGRRRTGTSAQLLWDAIGRVMRFLATAPDPPAEPAQLRARHLKAFHEQSGEARGEFNRWRDLRYFKLLTEQPPLREQVPGQAADYLSRRMPNTKRPAKPGYSDREFTELVTAARSDVANIRDRIRRGEALLADYQADPGSLSDTERARGALLAAAGGGELPRASEGDMAARVAWRMALARELFVTIADMPPLLALFVAVTNRNVETIKELPVEHRILEGHAVELRVVKRRRGQKRWHETVSWEIGKPGRELHTPGGLYLLTLELTARGRALSGARFLWSVWRGWRNASFGGVAEHDGMFDRKLNRNIYATDWAESRGLSADRAGSPATVEASPVAQTRTITVEGRWVRRKPAPGTLRVDFNRLKTSTEVRRTKQAGGHLPSSARTNTIPTLFSSYLRDDPTTIEWAQEVVSAALADAERSALDAHRRMLETNGGILRVVPGPADTRHLREAGLDPVVADQAADGGLDTAWAACVDPDHHPATGDTCPRVSFLDCFHCGNCLITRNQLPAQLGLLDALTTRRDQLSEDDWWARYGRVWAAITNDILVKFSAAEIEQAQAKKPDDALLDLLENPWEHP